MLNLFNVKFIQLYHVHVDMLEGPGEEKHCAYRATFLNKNIFIRAPPIVITLSVLLSVCPSVCLSVKKL